MLVHFVCLCVRVQVWRQLWRVCERSDILLVIVDVRMPLFNFAPSLYKYVTETLQKPLIMVLNKVDMVPRTVIDQWITYFAKAYPKLHVIPFTSYPRDTVTNDAHNPLKKLKIKKPRGMVLSAPYGAKELMQVCHELVSENRGLASLPEEVRKHFSLKPAIQTTATSTTSPTNSKDTADDSPSEDFGTLTLTAKEKKQKRKEKRKAKKKAKQQQQWDSDEEQFDEEKLPASDSDEEDRDNSNRGGQRVKFAHKALHDTDDEHDDETVDTTAYAGMMGNLEDDNHNPADSADHPAFITLGMIGYPNAGKSSVINALAGRKVVSVSSTPGHTKALQTLFLNPYTRLCDCPGT